MKGGKHDENHILITKIKLEKKKRRVVIGELRSLGGAHISWVVGCAVTNSKTEIIGSLFDRDFQRKEVYPKESRQKGVFEETIYYEKDVC